MTELELTEALTRLGGSNICSVDLKGKLDDIEKFIIVTGTSTRHLRKMSDAIVKAVSSNCIKRVHLIILLRYIPLLPPCLFS